MHIIYHHVYADDTQVHIYLSTTDIDISLTQLGDFFSDISDLDDKP